MMCHSSMTDSESSMDGVYPLADTDSSNSFDSFHRILQRSTLPWSDIPTNPADNNNSTGFIKFKFVIKREPDLRNHMDRVPDEIILLILGWLSQKDLIRFAQTCSRFNRLAYFPTFWRSVDMCALKRIDTDSLGHVLVRGTKYLAVQASTVFPPALSLPMQKNLKSQSIVLTHLNISYATISTQDINLLFSVLTNLEVLLMEEQRIDDTTCTLVAQNKKLMTLGMAMVVGLTAEGISSIVHACQSLQFINLAWATTQLGTQGCDQLVNEISPSLKEISLAGCAGLSSSHLETLMKRCKTLRKLDVSDNLALTPLTNPQFLLLQSLPLVGLYTSRTRLLDDLGDKWFEKMKHLKELDVVTLHMILNNYPSVTYTKAFDCGIARDLQCKPFSPLLFPS